MNLLRSVSLAAFLGTALTAHAGLFGHTVNVVGGFLRSGSPFVYDSGNRVVESGIEYGFGEVGGYDLVSLDFSDDRLVIDTSRLGTFTDPPFNGLGISLVDGGSFRTASYVGGGSRPYDLFVENGVLFVNMRGQRFESFETCEIQFSLSQASSVPGPLAALPFALIALRRRKRA